MWIIGEPKKKFSDERMREGIFFVGLAINVDENCDWNLLVNLKKKKKKTEQFLLPLGSISFEVCCCWFCPFMSANNREDKWGFSPRLKFYVSTFITLNFACRKLWFC